jgi:hypothetical protein
MAGKGLCPIGKVILQNTGSIVMAAKCRYRIREIKEGCFICEERGLIWGWNGMFKGSWSDMPHEFSTVREAEQWLKAAQEREPFKPRVIKEYGCDKKTT